MGVGDHHLPALLNDPVDHRTPNSLRAAGHNDGLSRKSSHSSLPSTLSERRDEQPRSPGTSGQAVTGQHPASYGVQPVTGVLGIKVTKSRDALRRVPLRIAHYNRPHRNSSASRPLRCPHPVTQGRRPRALPQKLHRPSKPFQPIMRGTSMETPRLIPTPSTASSKPDVRPNEASQTARDRLVYRDIWAQEGIRPPSDTARALIDALTPSAHGRRPHLADLGCGAGRHALHAARQSLRVTAVDHSTHAVAALRGAIDEEQLDCEVIQGDAFAWLRELPPATLDAVICFDSVHHSSADPERIAETLAQLGSRTRVGGSVLVTLLCDITYSTGERPPGRLLVGVEDGVALLDRALGGHRLLTDRRKPVRVARTTSISPSTGRPVPASYGATRVLRWYRIV
ncbi:class I SAM-dependent methyltransferase [Kitasatospora sp. NPDC087314]|uniref:class I SAM-dependent methyltransferase n=1 Tax=Kitasatospora sp. NPDC087314 TaxID=3364068 RepID=UPI0038111A03